MNNALIAAIILALFTLFGAVVLANNDNEQKNK